MADSASETFAPASKWDVYGFRSTPYSTNELGPDSQAEKLLVGRDEELKTLHSDLVSGASLMALEGDYGVGKSSLAAAAAFGASNWRVRHGDAYFLSTPQALELHAAETVDEFERRSYFQIARVILSNAKRLTADGNRLDGAQALTRWLLSPEGTGWNAGIGLSAAVLGGIELSGGKTRAANTSAGFTDAGVIAIIDNWLNELFPDISRGGVILRLDNLENLGRDYRLVETFESLRDRLFKRRGLRWILSGAEGMVRTALSSPKMTGSFAEPLDVLPIPHDLAPDVIRRRAEVLATRAQWVLPVEPDAFERIYTRTGRNLRFSLSLADTYSLRADAGRVVWLSKEERAEEFFKYVELEGDRVVRQLAKRLPLAAQKVLTMLVNQKNGFASPSEYQDFGYQKMPSLLAQITTLKDLGLVTYAVDEGDARRRRITVSNNGRLVAALRSADAPATPLPHVNDAPMG